ncbi:MAG: SH3 domain-containing protein [Geminicoccaceae bacterium]|nr:SH3 domain-containing protein [Geminicoccaceae bacterium]
MRPRSGVLLGLLLLLLPAPPGGAQTPGPEGLPVPRFVSVDSGKANVRTGPGENYPIRWVFTRPGVPVKIVEESGDWRRIEDPEGATGWIHGTLLSGRRTVMVTGDGVQDLHRRAEADSPVVLKVEPGVFGRLDGCKGSWCRIEVKEGSGWLPRGAVWGVLADE